jgi:phosphoribosylanthranilate isomerase
VNGVVPELRDILAREYSHGQVTNLPYYIAAEHAMFRIQICGVTTVEDALFAAEAGADAVGVDFREESPRRVDPALACEIVERLRDKYEASQVEVSAVFADASVDDILWTLRDAELYGPDMGVGIQLYGNEPPRILAELQQHGIGRAQGLLQALGHAPIVPIVRAFRSEIGLESIDAWLAECDRLGVLPDAVLIESELRGQFRGLPLILGGELPPPNVGQAIAAIRPDAVQATSGVESSPGKLDAAKVWAFVAAAKTALPKAAPATARRRQASEPT